MSQLRSLFDRSSTEENANQNVNLEKQEEEEEIELKVKNDTSSTRLSIYEVNPL
jgi:hypothetical protein